MKFLHRGKGRRRTTALVVAGALMAFQALAIVGAQSAFAVVNCTFTLATGAVTVTLDTAGDTATIDLSADTPAQIRVNATPCAGGSANVNNTTQINSIGTVAADENVVIDNDGPGGAFPASISWAVDGGGGAADSLSILGSDGADAVTVANTAFTMNGAAGVTAGIEDVTVNGGLGDDVIDASAVTATGPVLALSGGADDDTVTGGAGDDVVNGDAGDDLLAGGAGDDTISGGAGVDVVDEGAAANGADFINLGDDDGDTIDYSGRTNAIALSRDDSLPDADDGEGCVNEDFVLATCEGDDVFNFNVYLTGAGNDVIISESATGVIDETFAPGPGDDDITGTIGSDTLDLSSATGPVVFDYPNLTATGQGTDTFDAFVDNFIGGDFDDTLIFDPAVVSFSGGAGIDTVDASAETTSVTIDLDDLDGGITFPGGVRTDDGTPDDLEAAIGGSANDSLLGNDLRNFLAGEDGDDTLSGFAGNDVMFGGLGNDTFTGGPGADTVNFRFSPNGVVVDLSLGFASGEGDDGFGDLLEIVVGSDFADTITGGPFAAGGTVNFRFVGRRGNDILTGFNGNDTLKGGAGNDVVRGAAGDDLLAGARGNDRLFGGSGTDVGRGGKGKDICRGVEIKRSCGTRQNPRAPQVARLI